MNLWRLSTMNLHELIRRLRAGETRTAISRAMQLSVNTVKHYRRWAEAQGLLEGPLLDLAALEARRQQTYKSDRAPRHPNQSTMEGYRQEITDLVQQGYRPRAIWNIWSRRYPGCAGSESAVWRLVQSIRASQPQEVVLRIETAPGEVAQVDFGYVGYLLDPERGVRRKAWAFVTPALALRASAVQV